MKVIKAIYNFIVGDMVILVGITLAVIILALINTVPVLAPLKGLSGPFLILAVLTSLVASLSREAFSSKLASRENSSEVHIMPALQVSITDPIFIGDFWGFILALPTALFLSYWISSGSIKHAARGVFSAFAGALLGFLVILGWVGTLIFSTPLPGANGSHNVLWLLPALFNSGHYGLHLYRHRHSARNYTSTPSILGTPTKNFASLRRSGGWGKGVIRWISEARSWLWLTPRLHDHSLNSSQVDHDCHWAVGAWTITGDRVRTRWPCRTCNEPVRS